MAAGSAANAPLSFLRKAPWVGILALLCCYTIIPVMHILMTGIAHWLNASQFNVGLVMGIIGVALNYVGARGKTEIFQTWLGFFAGNLIFTGWIEFGNDWWAEHLGTPPLLRTDGSVELLPGMRVMMVGSYFFAALSPFFLFNRETYCRLILWIRRWLRLDVGHPTANYERNFANITTWEIIAVTWFLYIPLLAMYDRTIFGPEHWVTYAGFFIFIVWGCYCAFRLFQFKRFAPSLRYAIPTSIILWCPVEIASEWRLFEELWTHPWKYKLECALIVGALGVFVVMARYTLRRKISVEDAAAVAGI
jgi:hypothetical protein